MPELLEYKCPNCGGALEFNSTTQNMKCPYCDGEFSVEELKNIDEILGKKENLEWASPAGGEWNENETHGMYVYACNSCGGEIVADETTAATECPYCGNPVVMARQFSEDLKPDKVIPFKLDKNAAKMSFYEHLKHKTLLPSVFKKQTHIDEIKGIYVPFWLFDTDADANATFNATRVRQWSDSKFNYTETSHYLVLRSGKMHFDDIPVDGSSKMPDDLMESLEPFNYSEAVDFQTAYLAGYLADKYDVSADESVNRANTRIKSTAETVLRSTVTGYTSVTQNSVNVGLANGNVSYALYPVWILNTTWNNKKFVFAMNGQTGKFVGNLPVDIKKAALWFSGIAVAASGILTGIAALLGML